MPASRIEVLFLSEDEEVLVAALRLLYPDVLFVDQRPGCTPAPTPQPPTPSPAPGRPPTPTGTHHPAASEPDEGEVEVRRQVATAAWTA